MEKIFELSWWLFVIGIVVFYAYSLYYLFSDIEMEEINQKNFFGILADSPEILKLAKHDDLPLFPSEIFICGQCYGHNVKKGNFKGGNFYCKDCKTILKDFEVYPLEVLFNPKTEKTKILKVCEYDIPEPPEFDDKEDAIEFIKNFVNS